MKKLTRGLLLVFEGIDGTGKSTQQQLLGELLRNEGYEVVITREPTEGEYGMKIRALYQNRSAVSVDEELELFISDRKEHVRDLIEPALTERKIVLCDRYYLSTAAYQGTSEAEVKAIIERNQFAPSPDIAFILEVSLEESIRRITVHRGDVLNDFEQTDTLRRVDRLFKGMDFPYIRRIDGSGPIDQISKQIRVHTKALIQDHTMQVYN